MSALVKTKEPKQIRLLLPKGTGASSSSLPAANPSAAKDTSKDSAAPGAHSAHCASSSVPDIQATLASLGVPNDGLLYMVFAIDDGSEKFEDVQVPDFEPLTPAE